MVSVHSVRVQLTNLHAYVDIQSPLSFTEETSLSPVGVYQPLIKNQLVVSAQTYFWALLNSIGLSIFPLTSDAAVLSVLALS